MVIGLKKKKVLCIIQARISSSRLPGKVLLTGSNNKSLLETLYKRLLPSKHIKEIIIATSTNQADDLIFDECKKNNMKVFRGSLPNVLKRYYDCAKKYKGDIIIRITSDCPLLEYKLIDKLFLEFNRQNCDYLSNVHPATFPDGYDVEIFTFDSLKKAFKEGNKNYEREHVTPYIWDNPKKFVVKNYYLKKNYSKLRVTLDYLEDYFLIKKIFNYFENKKNYFDLSDVLKFLKKNKKLIKNKKFSLVNWYRLHMDKLKTVKKSETIDINKLKYEKFK